jgi:RNA polymerase sigma-70 factor (ECF subfamily)
MAEEIAAVTPSEETTHVVAFEAFFETTRARLFRSLVLITHDPGEAEEIMQDAFVRVWERWDHVGTMDDPVGYLFRTAMNLHRSRLRRALVAAKRAMRSTEGADPFDEVAARDEALRSLALLTPRQRAAIVTTELLGYSSDEAGAILGIRPGTVRALTSRARATLLAWKEFEDA